MTGFTSLHLQEELLRAVTDLGYSEPTPIQSEVIPLLLAGSDVIGQAKTGTGKTAAFALPILHHLEGSSKNVQVLVVAPTRELALQVSRSFKDYARYKRVSVLAVYGGQPYAPQIDKLQRGVDIVVGTPGRLIDLMEKKALHVGQVRHLVLDEADEMLSMGFIEDIETILASVPATRQTALFSATMPNEVRRLAERFMRHPQTVSVRDEELTVAETAQRYYLVYKKDKLAALTRLLETERFGQTLVFVRTRAGSSELANQLTSRGYTAEALNGDLTQDARERTLDRFRQGKVKMLVATDVAARGLDIENISHVVNYDLPEFAEAYVHRIGRTGRAGRQGSAISLVAPSERHMLKQIERYASTTVHLAELPSDVTLRQMREDALMERMKTWLSRGRCRAERKMVEALAAEGEYDIYDIAAAALKLARAEEKQRPLDAVETVVVRDRQPRRPLQSQSSSRQTTERLPRDKFSSISHEAGMIRLRIDAGKQDQVRPTDLVGAIAGQYNLPGAAIGKIILNDAFSLVDVPEAWAQVIVRGNKPLFVRKTPVKIAVAG